MDNDKNQMQQASLDITPEMAAGVYSNMAMVSHSPTDFVLDFSSMLPGMPRPMVRSRVIMAPEHAKRLMLALMENVKKYEATFGTINLTQDAANQGIAPFKLPQGEA